MTITIPVTLPDDLAEQARAKGLLSSASLATLIAEAVKNDCVSSNEDAPYPSDMDSRLKGAVNPLAFQRGKVVGDIVN